jgi:hypothetical protein
LAKDKTIEIKSDVRFSQIKPDQRNTNKHTDIGMRSLDSSLDQVGIVESITISNDNVIISGNARHEKIGQKYKKDPVIIETDGTTPIVIKRTDIESGTKEFHKASILSNSVAQKNQNIDIELVEVIADEFDFDVSDVFVEIEQEEDKEHKENIKELSNMIACTLTEEESEIWLKTKESIGKMKDKNAIFELIKLYTNETNSK